MEIFLYHTEGCHLCDVAKEKIDNALLRLPEKTIKVTRIDLIDDADALERYSLSIPEVKDPEGNELFWPFDVPAIVEFLKDTQDESC